MSQILTELVKLANLIILLSRAMASLARVNAVFDISPSIPDRGRSVSAADHGVSSHSVPAVSFEHVSFAYAGSGQETLRDITFTAMAGETIGIIGGTGSGKSTLANLIPRFYDCTSGSVRLFGQDVRSLRPSSIRERVGIVPQKAVLFSGSLRQNMQWGKKNAADEEIYRALDFATDARLRKAIREHTGQMTVFIISQRVSAIRDADHILVMDNGRAEGYGTHEELLRGCPIYQEIYASQNAGKEAASHA